MQCTLARGRPRRAALALTALLGLAACASLDVVDELGTAQRLVGERAGVPVDWSEPWSSPSWPPEQPLTVADAARLALHNHAGIRASIESIVQARAVYVQAHLLPNPVVNFTLGLPFDGGPGNPAMSTLLQPLAALWQRPAAIDAAGSRLRAVVLQVSNASLELVAQAGLAHARLVFAERDLALETEARDLAAEALALVELRLAQGEAAQLERNRVALEVLSAESLVTDATVRRDRARRTLLEVCGVADEFAMPLTDDTPAAVPRWLPQLAERDLVRMAQDQRLDLAAAGALMEGAIDEARLAELRRIPDVSVGIGYQRNFGGRSALGPALALELPIFDDGRAQVAKAESLARAAAAETERVRQGVVAEVRGAWVQLGGELANLARLRDSVLALAAANLSLAEQSLAAGVIDRGSVLELARSELRARLAASAVELAAIEWFIELERAVGGRLIAPEEVER